MGSAEEAGIEGRGFVGTLRNPALLGRTTNRERARWNGRDEGRAVVLCAVVVDVRLRAWGRGPRRLLELLRGWWGWFCLVILFSSGRVGGGGGRSRGFVFFFG